MLCYVIRHAESLVNAGQGTGADPELSPLGFRQADAVAARLAGTRIAAVYSSPFRRAFQTAAPLARQLRLPIRVRHELCEFQTAGLYADEGFVPPSFGQIQTACPLAVRDPDDDGAAGWPPADEALEACIARMHRFGRFLRARWNGAEDTVVAFSHGLPVARFIDSWLTDVPGRSFRFVIENAAVAALRDHKGVASLVCMNEASHLTGLPAPAASHFDDRWTVKPLPPTNAW